MLAMLVALGFVSESRETFYLFAAVVLPALFILGMFTTVRLVDTGIENLQFLRGIARIRGYYRTLTPEAAVYFSAESGRRPEGALGAATLVRRARCALDDRRNPTILQNSSRMRVRRAQTL